MTKAQVLILLGGLATLGLMVGALQDWHDAATPAFVGAAIANVCTHVAGLMSKGPEQ